MLYLPFDPPISELWLLFIGAIAIPIPLVILLSLKYFTKKNHLTSFAIIIAIFSFPAIFTISARNFGEWAELKQVLKNYQVLVLKYEAENGSIVTYENVLELARLSNVMLPSAPLNSTAQPKEMMKDSWSKEEKEVAKKAFDIANDNKLKEIIDAVKCFNLETWEDLASLTAFIKKKEKDIDRAFDYRYSVLIISFGNFVREGLITIKDLEGLSEDKIDKIIKISKL